MKLIVIYDAIKTRTKLKDRKTCNILEISQLKYHVRIQARFLRDEIFRERPFLYVLAEHLNRGSLLFRSWGLSSSTCSQTLSYDSKSKFFSMK